MNAFTAAIARHRPISVAMSRRQRIEAIIEHLLTVLDLADGDPDIEVDDEDRCEAVDDAPIAGATVHGSDRWSHLPGDPDDEEDDEPEDDRDEV